MPTRREAFRAGALAGVSLLARAAGAQAPLTTGAMDETRYRSVRLPPRGGGPSMSPDERDALEHRLHCQCGCRLDIYTCRTTDFTCPLSPAMHRDVTSLVEGGYGAQEIIDAFVGAYGERVLMAPTKSGFNWAGWVMPFAALGGGAAFIVLLLRRWRATQRARGQAMAGASIDATPAELAQLERDVRSDA
jgi:cytochrome c-type biogenesis protein CcmH